MTTSTTEQETSLLLTMLKERKELKGKEIIRVEEKRQELGLYALVAIQPAHVASCRCPNYQFKGSQFIYHFGYAYLVSDKLKRVGIACEHYNSPPSEEYLNRGIIRGINSKNERFFNKVETKLEKQFEQAFGAA